MHKISINFTLLNNCCNLFENLLRNICTNGYVHHVNTEEMSNPPIMVICGWKQSNFQRELFPTWVWWKGHCNLTCSRTMFALGNFNLSKYKTTSLVPLETKTLQVQLELTRYRGRHQPSCFRFYVSKKYIEKSKKNALVMKSLAKRNWNSVNNKNKNDKNSIFQIGVHIVEQVAGTVFNMKTWKEMSMHREYIGFFSFHATKEKNRNWLKKRIVF